MNMAQDLEINILQEAFHKITKASDSPLIGQVPQRENTFVHTFQRQPRSTGDSISAELNEIFESESYYIDSEQGNSSRRLICSTAGAGKEYKQSHSRKLESGLSVSPFFIRDIDAPAPAPAPAVSERDIVSKFVLPTEDRDVEKIQKGKKRSRASRKPPTTVLEADSTNFRSMVQQLTGIPTSPILSNLPAQKGCNYNTLSLVSQVCPPLCSVDQNVSKLHAYSTPAPLQPFRQSLMSKAMNVRRNVSIPSELQPASAGIPLGNLPKHIPHPLSVSALQNGSWTCTDLSSLYASISSTSPNKCISDS